MMEWVSTQTYTLKGKPYELKHMLHTQPARHAFVSIMRTGGRGFVTRDVPDPLEIPETEAALVTELKEKSIWISKAEDTPLVENQPRYQALLTTTQILDQEYTGLEPDEK